MSEETTVNVKGLDQLMKAIKGKLPQVRIGVLGSNNARTGGSSTNAQVGAAHEFGTTTIPQRSFLRVPLAENLGKELENAGALDEDVLKGVIRKGDIIPWLEKVAIVAESIVLGAFDSGGYGHWVPWKNPSYENNSGQLLVDTHQLRDSISTEVG